ncbi:MAG: hypothetical protein ACK2UC_11360 [Anaerolineae bacterium]
MSESPRPDIQFLPLSADPGRIRFFGTRLIITALQTDYPLQLSSRNQGPACADCLSCLQVCPQAPVETAVIESGRCQSCAQCLIVCPVGAD